MKYGIRCSECNKIISDDGHILACHPNALLKTEYTQKEFKTKRENKGIWKFIDWLPVQGKLDTNSGPITYRSEGLADKLKLKNLYFSFTGYWPERKAFTSCCTFKDLESQPVVQRNIDFGYKPLVLATDGNTGRSFAYLSTLYNLPVHIVIPENSLERLWLPIHPSKAVHVYAVRGDYCEAIEAANKLSKLEGVVAEGGAKNIARRDGMATVILDAVEVMKRLPDHYFQAVGSGPGAIAAWEASKRVVEDGSYGSKLPKINIAQNFPFIPIPLAFLAGRREILPEDIKDAEKSIKEIDAKVLSNRKPAYSVRGGLYDALTETKGNVFSITNQEAKEAGELFTNLEGIDLLSPAKVTIAALIKAVEEKKVGFEEYILVNVTGGGYKKLVKDFPIYYIKPEKIIDKSTNLENLLNI